MFPLFQHRPHQPRWQVVRAIFDRCTAYLGIQQRMSKSDRACDPVGPGTIWTQAEIPVEVCRTGLQGNGYITEPEGTPSAMLQEVNAEVRELVLGTEDANRGSTEIHGLRSMGQVGHGPTFQQPYQIVTDVNLNRSIIWLRDNRFQEWLRAGRHPE